MTKERFGLSPTVPERLWTWFSAYAEDFVSRNPASGDMMALKKDHTRRVSRTALDIGRRLKLDLRELNLVEVTALLHDIGRFEQYERFRTFSDKISVNHALLGVSICRKENILHDVDEETAELILRVISYHNRAAVPADETPSCVFYSRLLRDSDKLDIWDVVLRSYENPSGIKNASLIHDLPDRLEISSVVIDSIRREAIVSTGDMRTLNDFKLFHMSWVFDINFRRTFEILRKRRYLERLRDSLKEKGAAEDAFLCVSRYCRRRLGGPECSVKRERGHQNSGGGLALTLFTP
ncbi:MAG: HD domain-containing protein [Acidobacteria bacterium]|nr:HD domain-containing protein [Acidobacteriota bacterium]